MPQKTINKKSIRKPEYERFNLISYIFINLSKHRLRTIFTIIGIAVPISFFILFAAMGEGLDQYIIDHSYELNKQNYIDMSEIVNAWTNVLMLIIAVMIITNITNTILMSTVERKREFGILKAIGLRHDQIVYLVIFEGFLISTIALIVGVIIGIWGAMIFDYMFWLNEGTGFFFAPATITLNSILIVAILTIFIGTITSIYPAYSISNKSTIEVLRYE